jgi:hypothetical protein
MSSSLSLKSPQSVRDRQSSTSFWLGNSLGGPGERLVGRTSGGLAWGRLTRKLSNEFGWPSAPVR